MPGSKTPLIIPVETQIREFDAKLLLACVAAERGFPAIMGQRTEIHIRILSMPRGIYLAKDLRRSSLRMFEILRKLGHEIVAWDEEGLVPYDREREYKVRFCAASMDHVSDLFAWGDENADLIRGFPAYTGAPIHVTGNARFDMLRPELKPFFDDEVVQLRQRYGNFVLINTNFGVNNHYVPKLGWLKTNLGNANSLAGGEVDAVKAGLAEYRSTMFSSFLELVPALARKFPGQNFILRPHPSENHEPWEKAAAGLDNVSVVHEGSVIQWLLAAAALVHNGCTTGIEAFVMRVPAIAYRPISSSEYDRELPNAVCHQVHDFECLSAKLRSVLAGETGSCNGPEEWQLIKRHVASLDGSLASDRIIDVLEQVDVTYRERPRPHLPDYLRGRYSATVRGATKRLNAFRRDHKNSAVYQRRRFPGVSLNDVRDRIKRFQRNLGRFAGLEAQQISRNVFRITAT